MNGKKILRSRSMWVALVPAAAAGFPLLELYLRNRAEFTFGPGAVLAGMLLAAAAVFLVSFLLLRAAGRSWKWSLFLHAALLGAGVSLMLQSSVWSGLFPDFEPALFRSGGGAPWILGAFHLVFLLTPPVLCCRFRLLCFRFARQLSWIALAAALAPVLARPEWRVAPEYGFQEYEIVWDGEFTFASGENVIVLVVDCMSEYLFKEVLRDSPDLAAALRDFTCFDRMTSPIPRTRYAVPAMLTGVEFDGDVRHEVSEEHARYLRESGGAPGSLFRELRREGFRIEAYPYILQTVCYSPEVLDNVRPVSTASRRRSASTLAGLWLARLVPAFLRPLLPEFGTGELFVPPAGHAASGEPHDRGFYRQLGADAKTGEFPRGFKYFHLQGAHDPVGTDRNLEPAFATDRREQLRGSLRNLELLLGKLREAGLYDAATIVVSGDHTERYTPETVTLIKRPGERRTELRFNAVPCRVAEIAGTVLKESGIRPGAASLFDRPEVAGGGEARASALPRTLTTAGWSPVQPEEDPFADPYPGAFLIEEGAVSVIAPSEGEIPVTLRFRVESPGRRGPAWAGGEFRTDSAGTRFDRYRSPELRLPDGIYVVYFSGDFLSEGDGQPEIARRSWFLPRYLEVKEGAPRFREQPPELPPRGLPPGEKLSFHPMRLQPELRLAGEYLFGSGFLQMREGATLTVNLDRAFPPAAAELEFRLLAELPATVLIYDGDRRIGSRRFDDLGLVSLRLALPPETVAAGVWNLRFELDRPSHSASAPARRPRFLIRSLELLDSSR